MCPSVLQVCIISVAKVNRICSYTYTVTLVIKIMIIMIKKIIIIIKKLL